MAYENIDFKYGNFCIAPITSTFGSIDTTNAAAVMQIRNSSGAVQGNYTLNPTIPQNSTVDSFIYTGPTNTSSLSDGMPFFTLQRVDDSNCTIKRWELNNTSNRLDLVQTLNITDSGSDNFDCYTASLEHYNTGFSAPTASGTGYINVSSTARMVVGDTIYLGPSSHANNINAFEMVLITAISGSRVDIVTTISGGPSAPSNYYNSYDPITYYKDILLFSNIGDSGDTTKGTLFRLNATSGAVMDKHSSGLYKDVIASRYGIPYTNTVAFIKSSNILYVDIDDFEIKKSQSILNTKSDNMTAIITYDIDFTNTVVYRLQKETTLRNDNGTQSDYTWANYNYQQDSIIPYVDSLAMWSAPTSTLHNQEQTTVYALVRDQYGNTLPGIVVFFDKVSGDSSGNYDDINKQDTTDSSGIASLTYTSGWYDPNIADSCCDIILLTTRAAGSSTYTGSQYIWGNLSLDLLKKYIHVTYPGVITQKLDTVGCTTILKQLVGLYITYILKSLSKFWFPGGDGDYPLPAGNAPLIKQILDFTSTSKFMQAEDFESIILLEQLPTKTDTLQLSQTYISRHMSSGNKDAVTINQFRFLIDAIPKFWSEKNSVDTTVWIRLAPFGYDLDAASLSFKVREVSYAGDTGFIEYADTANIVVNTYDAGGGLLGLDITVTPIAFFHSNAVVYVYIVLYDKAPIPNRIMIDYWFKTIADYKAPFITNELPARESLDVPVDTDIEFDLLDLNVGVDISSLEFYVNNRRKIPTVTTIAQGYHIKYTPEINFHFGQTVEVAIRVKDASDQANYLFDTYRFHCVASSGPWFDLESLSPAACKSGVYRKLGEVSINVYAIDDAGIDIESITLDVDRHRVNISTRPIILRIM
jgi:hypothetical protein